MVSLLAARFGFFEIVAAVGCALATFLWPGACPQQTSLRPAPHLMCAFAPGKTRSAKERWECLRCTSSRPRGDNQNTPVRGERNISSVGNTPLHTPKAATHETPLTAAELTCFTGAFRKFKSDFDEMQTKICEFTSSVEYCHGMVNDVTKSLESVKDRLACLERREQQREAEFTTLKQKVIQLEARLEERDQADMRNEVEISGINEAKGENLNQIVAVIAAKIGVQLQESDVDSVSRAGPRRSPGEEQRPRPVLVRLTRRAPRNEFLKAARVRRGLNTDDIAVSGPRRAIYINEHLTRTNRQLLQKTRALAKSRGHKFVWVRNGKILTRRQEGCDAERVRGETDLFRLFGEDPAARDCLPTAAAPPPQAPLPRQSPAQL